MHMWLQPGGGGGEAVLLLGQGPPWRWEEKKDNDRTSSTHQQKPHPYIHIWPDCLVLSVMLLCSDQCLETDLG